MCAGITKMNEHTAQLKTTTYETEITNTTNEELIKGVNSRK